MAAKPVADGLFEWPSEAPRLLAGRCGACGTVAFPRAESCARCSASPLEQIALPREGRLWSFTVQRFRPKEPYDGPQEFSPYGVGYVELAGQVIVEGRLTVADPAALKIGDRVEVCVVPYTTAADGSEVVTFAFRPVAASE
jgi:uncharacterized OB-fold protein